MPRKILSILFFVVAALLVIGAVANGTLMSNFLANLLVTVLYALAGLFLLRFDDVYQKSRVEGYKLRARQCTFILAFVVAFLILMLLAAIGAGASGGDNFLVGFLLAALPFYVPMVIFLGFMAIYVIPYKNCRKCIPMDEEQLNAHFAGRGAFTALTDDGSVLASNEALFFPRLFCLVPFGQIASVKLYNFIEQDVIFTLTNGRKLVLVSSKAQFEAIQAAVGAHKP